MKLITIIKKKHTHKKKYLPTWSAFYDWRLGTKRMDSTTAGGATTTSCRPGTSTSQVYFVHHADTV